jgi:hypothetical protein
MVELWAVGCGLWARVKLSAVGQRAMGCGPKDEELKVYGPRQRAEGEAPSGASRKLWLMAQSPQLIAFVHLYIVKVPSLTVIVGDEIRSM